MIQLNDLIIAKFNQFIVEFSFDMNQKFKEYSLKIGNLGHIIFHTTSTIDKINDNSYYLSINGNNLGKLNTMQNQLMLIFHLLILQTSRKII